MNGNQSNEEINVQPSSASAAYRALKAFVLALCGPP